MPATFKDRPGHYEFPAGTQIADSGGLQDITGAVFVPDDDTTHPIPVFLRRSTMGSAPTYEVINQAPGADPRAAENVRTLTAAQYQEQQAAAVAAIIQRVQAANKPPVAAADGQYLFGPDTHSSQPNPNSTQLRNVVFVPTGGGQPQLVTLTAEGQPPVYKRLDAANPSNNPATIDAAAFNGVATGAGQTQPGQGTPGHGTPQHPNWESTGIAFPEARSTRDMVMDALRRRGVDVNNPEAVRQAVMQMQRGIRDHHSDVDLGPFGEQQDGIDGKVGPFTTRGIKTDRGITENRPLTQAEVDATVNAYVPQGQSQAVQPSTQGLNVSAAAVGSDQNVITGVTYTPQNPPGSPAQPGEIRRTGAEGGYTYAFHPATGADVPLQAQDWQAAQAAIAARTPQTPPQQLDVSGATFGTQNGTIDGIGYNETATQSQAPQCLVGSLVRVAGTPPTYEFRTRDGAKHYPVPEDQYVAAAQQATLRELGGMGQGDHKLDRNNDGRFSDADLDRNGDNTLDKADFDALKADLEAAGVTGVHDLQYDQAHAAQSFVALVTPAMDQVKARHQGPAPS